MAVSRVCACTANAFAAPAVFMREPEVLIVAADVVVIERHDPKKMNLCESSCQHQEDG